MAEDGEEWTIRIENDESYRRELTLLFKDLRSQAISNAEYFQDTTGINNERFFSSFNILYEHLDLGIEPGIDQLVRLSHLYDLDSRTPANGYRSMVRVVHKCCIHLLQLSRYITVNRESFIFRSGHYSRELEAYVTTLGQLRACLYYLQKLIKFCGQGMLFPDEDSLDPESYAFAESLMMEVEALSQDAFYGRCLGFQYCDSMVKPLMTINLVMASFSDGYYQTNSSTMMKVASSVISGSKYLIDPEERAEKVIEVTRNGGIEFCKAFWSLAENNLMHSLPLFICPPVQVDKVILIPADTFELPHVSGDGTTVRIAVPCAHMGPAPVSTRLISHQLREGQEKWKSLKESKTSPTPVMPKSTGLMIHFHGGGFVAQSSASHEVYLRHWAKETGVPILSVDYSLAPENPFPRQLEEGFFAYCWALKHCHELGTSAEKVVLVGDSAGGNLAFTVTLRAIANKVRKPDGILSTYGCMLVKYIPSPSRLLSLMDPLLPLGILSRCLAAYAGMSEDSVISLPSMSSLRSPASKPQSPQSPHPPPQSNNTSSPKHLLQEAFNLNDLNEQSTNQRGQKNSNEDLVNGSAADDIMAAGICDQTSPMSSGGTSPRNLSLDLSRVSIGSSGSGGSERRKMHVRTPSSPTFSTSPLARNRMVEGHIPFQPTTPTYAKVRHFAQSPMIQFRQMPIGNNPFMSPYQASDELLEQVPPVYFVACQLDPMLDDSLMLAKRLRSLGNTVIVDVLDDLPHGFLNFTLVSYDARQGSEVCIARLIEMLRDEEDDEVELFDALDSD